MLNPAYSLDEQAQELLLQAEMLLEVGIVPIYTRPKLEMWVEDLRAFRQRRLIAEAVAPRAQKSTDVAAQA